MRNFRAFYPMAGQLFPKIELLASKGYLRCLLLNVWSQKLELVLSLGFDQS